MLWILQKTIIIVKDCVNRVKWNITLKIKTWIRKTNKSQCRTKIQGAKSLFNEEFIISFENENPADATTGDSRNIISDRSIMTVSISQASIIKFNAEISFLWDSKNILKRVKWSWWICNYLWATRGTDSRRDSKQRHWQQSFFFEDDDDDKVEADIPMWMGRGTWCRLISPRIPKRRILHCWVEKKIDQSMLWFSHVLYKSFFKKELPRVGSKQTLGNNGYTKTLFAHRRIDIDR